MSPLEEEQQTTIKFLREKLAASEKENAVLKQVLVELEVPADSLQFDFYLERIRSRESNVQPKKAE